MLTRYRWLRIQIPFSLQKLIEKLLQNQFSQNVECGFRVSSDNIEKPEIRFFWRTKISVTQIDEDGAPSSQEIETINYTDFAIICIKNNIFLRIKNPGRNIRDLLNSLESIIGFGFTSEQLTFDKVTPTQVFQKVDASKLVGLKVVGAVVNDDLVARMEFASKQGMNTGKIKLLDGLRYKVDSAVYELHYEGIKGQLSFSSSGTLKISGQLAPMLIHLIELDLPNML